MNKLKFGGATHLPSTFSLAPLPDFGRSGDALTLLIGNSKAMWPLFLGWLRDHPAPELADPVDTFTSQVIGRAVSEFAGDTRYDIFWASDMSPERLVDMNRASLVCGSCYFSDEMYLSIHPKCVHAPIPAAHHTA